MTSAARYADAVPWEYLKSAAERSAAVAMVLQRVPPAALTEVPAHLGQMMAERGLGDSPLFAVPETVTDAEGLFPTRQSRRSGTGWPPLLPTPRPVRQWR